jgi:hypothetical protein
LSRDDFSDHYWTRIHKWYASGGNAHVAAYLRHLDLLSFDAKAPPPKTPAWWDIVSSSRAPEDAEMADALERCNNPEVTTLGEVAANEVTESFSAYLLDRKNSRRIPHRFESCGYVPLRNDGAADGLWKVLGRRQVIYAKKNLSVADQRRKAKERYGV